LVAGLLVAGLGCEDPPRPEAASAAAAAPKPAAPAPGPAAVEPEPVAKEPAAPAEKKQISCPKPPQVAFTDAALEAEVRRKAGKLEGNVTLADLKKVRSVDLTRGGKPTDSLDPCIFPLLTNLHHVYLGGGALSDLSPLATLTQVEGLRASMNQVAIITPLAGMLQMDRLDLGRTQVRDLTPLKRMTKLTELMLDDTPIDDLSPLAGLANLERLSIKRTRVTDVSPLKGLRKLKFLYVAGSNVASVTSIQRPGLKISNED
jgi:internalin A